MEERSMKETRLLLNMDSSNAISDIAGDMMDINNTVEIILDTLETEIGSLAEIIHSTIPTYMLKRFTPSLFYLLRQNRKCTKNLLSLVDSAEIIPETKDICPSVWAELEKQA